MTNDAKLPPVIITPYGQTTEAARYRAAMNMKADPAVKARVVALIGEAKAKRDFPEAFSDAE